MSRTRVISISFDSDLITSLLINKTQLNLQLNWIKISLSSNTIKPGISIVK